MRIRRRDKDHPGAEGEEPRVALYDQEVSASADRATSPIAGAAAGEASPAESGPAVFETAAASSPTTPPPSEDLSPSTPAEPAQAGYPASDVAPQVTQATHPTPEPTASDADPIPADPPTAVPAGAPGVMPAEEAVISPPEPTPAPEVDDTPPAPAATPKHAMRAPSIGDEAIDLLNGSKPVMRELPRIIAIANQKGGVGKTTTTVNLGAALAELDYRVLVIDLDPQGNATTGLGVEARNFELSMYDVIMRDQPLEDCIEPTSVKHLFVAPATIDLAGVEIELVPAFSRELKLKRAIDTVVDDFDFVLIDCPPSLGLITVNGLAAADEVLVPIQCEYYALEGLSQLLRNVNLVSTNLNQTLEVSTIVLTMYDARTRLSVDVANEVREHFSERVCRAVIPRTVRLSEAPSFGQPITVFDPTSRGAVAYRELAKEVSNGAPQRSR